MSEIAMNEHDTAARIADKMFAGDQFSHLLGIEIVRARADESLCRMTLGKQHLNGHGTCHGGALFALADTTFAHLCNADNNATVAHICQIAYWAPGYEGDTIIAKAVANGQYGRSGSYTITLHRNDEQGETIAEFQGYSRTLRGQKVLDDI